jgi:26S proteasome regulatory subunit T1
MSKADKKIEPKAGDKKDAAKDAKKDDVAKDDKGKPLTDSDIRLFNRYGKGPYND